MQLSNEQVNRNEGRKEKKSVNDKRVSTKDNKQSLFSVRTAHEKRHQVIWLIAWARMTLRW